MRRHELRGWPKLKVCHWSPTIPDVLWVGNNAGMLQYTAVYTFKSV